VKLGAGVCDDVEGYARASEGTVRHFIFSRLSNFYCRVSFDLVRRSQRAVMALSKWRFERIRAVPGDRLTRHGQLRHLANKDPILD
jgi:hypothetical protein